MVRQDMDANHAVEEMGETSSFCSSALDRVCPPASNDLRYHRGRAHRRRLRRSQSTHTSKALSALRPLLDPRSKPTEPPAGRRTVHLTHFIVRQYLLCNLPTPGWLHQNDPLTSPMKSSGIPCSPRPACSTLVSAASGKPFPGVLSPSRRPVHPGLETLLAQPP